ncbi:MAG: type VI secretion system baseplate subunit TssE [Rhodocyclales bacterium GT-UBC]|nr:MAG: type VI secretion system baseplate subunit TssE [Rhodocyclales bacterium GT-UBC]
MRPDRQHLLIKPSVFDRLLDDHPREQHEHQQHFVFDLRKLKQAVARDMEALLNSRNIDLDHALERFPESQDSMIDFGITDLSSLSLLDPGDRAYLRDKIRITVERHEPRLGRIRVSLDPPSGNERMLRFRVDAILKVLPTKPPVSFDATLQLSSNACQIRET